MAVDLYHILLKDVEPHQFGGNLIDAFASKKKRGEVKVSTKKLLVTYDGEEYAPVDCQSISVKFEGDAVVLDVVLEEGSIKPDNEEENGKKSLEDIPQAEAVIPVSETDTFALQGDDLEAFKLLSNFHRAENRDQQIDNGIEPEMHALESGVFDIQDLTSVQNAMLDIVEQEKQFIDQGYKVFEVNTPQFDYENSNNFKLIESVSLRK